MRNTAVRSLLYSGDLLGVDLGSHAVKVLHLRRSGKRLAVAACAQREVWKELAAARTEEEQRAVYARALRELAGGKWLNVRAAAVSLPGNAVLVRFLDVTGKKRVDARTGLPADALAMIPFDPAEAELDARTRPAGGAPGREELMLVFAPKKAVANGLEILKEAGLVANVVINDALAAGDAYAYLGAGAAGTRVLVNIGAGTTSVSVEEHGHCRSVRVLNIAGAAFTRAVRKEFGVEPEAAEKLKRWHGLDGTGEEGERVARAMRPAVRDLCVEVRRTIDAFLDKRSSEHLAIDSVVLSGGGADTRGLDRVMREELALPVEVFRPLLDAHANPGLKDFDKRSASFAVAAGLTLSNVLQGGSAHERFNLLPKGHRRAAAMNQFSSRTVLVSAAIAALLAAAGLGAYGWQRRRLAAEEARFDARLAETRRELAVRRAGRRARKSKAPEAAFGYLRSLQVTGVFGGGSFLMLAGGDRVFGLRGGRLYDESDKEIAGVSGRVEGGAVVLSAGRGETYRIPLPK